MPNIHRKLSDLFSAIADAIREKQEKPNQKYIADDFPEEIDNIIVEAVGTPEGESPWLSDEKFMKYYLESETTNLGYYKNSSVNAIKPYGMYGQQFITSISFPNCSVIGSYAFNGCSNLINANLPNTQIIDYSAFQNCVSLQSVTITDNVSIRSYAFQNTGLQTLYIPSTSYIGSYAFQNCTSLEAVNLPFISYINIATFDYCISLKTVNLPLCNVIDAYVFRNCSSLSYINIPKATSIYNRAFQFCSALQSISLPNCSYIAHYVFESCTSLQTISLPNCTYISDGAFLHCSGSLSSAYLPKLTVLNTDVFNNCQKLTSIYAPNISVIGAGALAFTNLSYFSHSVVEVIYRQAFYSCSNLKTINFPNLTQIHGSANFEGTGITSLYLPKLTFISNCDYMCKNCKDLISVDLPELTTNYYNYATYLFQGCEKLQYVNLPKLTYIPAYCFSECSSLVSVSLDAHTLSNYAFANCINLEFINFPNLQSLGTSVFYNCPKLNRFVANSTPNIPANTMFGNTGLEYVEATSASFVGSNAFRSTGLSSYSLPIVNTIYCYAFENTQISKADFPEVHTIHEYAFANCSKLSTINLPKWSTWGNSPHYIFMFANCTSLETVNLPNMPVVPGGIFQGCTKLSKIYMSNASILYPYALQGTAISTISAVNFPKLTAFSNAEMSTGGNDRWRYDNHIAECPNLEYVNLPLVSKIHISSYSRQALFWGCPNLDMVQMENLTSIHSMPFINADARRYSFPRISSLHPYIFYNNQRLEEVTLTALTSVPNYAFYSCYALKKADNEFGMDNVSGIGYGAFRYCSMMSEAVFPNVKSVLEYAFADCSSLEKAIFNNSEYTYIRSFTFFNTPIKYEASFPYVSKIDQQAFKGSRRIEAELAFPAITAANQINYMAFSSSGYGDMTYNQAVTKVNFPNLSECPSYWLFANNKQLEKVSMPLVSKLVSSCFYGCTKLSVIDLDWSNITTLPAHVFYGINTDNEEPLNLTFPALTTISADNKTCFYGANINILDLPELTTVTTYGLGKACKILKAPKLPTFTSSMIDSFYHYSSYRDTFEEIYLDNATRVGYGAIRDMQNLRKIYMPNVVNMNGDDFNNFGAYCPNLNVEDAFPNLEKINKAMYVLIDNVATKKYHFPKLTYLGFSGTYNGIFYGENVEEFIAPELTIISGSSADPMFVCPKLKKVYMPKYIMPSWFINRIMGKDSNGVNKLPEELHVGGGIIYSSTNGLCNNSYIKRFYGWEGITNIYFRGIESCTSLENSSDIKLNVCSYIQGHAFNNCSWLKTIRFESSALRMDYPFHSCSNLSKIWINNLTSMYRNTSYAAGFAYTKLEDLYIMNSEALPACNTTMANIFQSSPILDNTILDPIEGQSRYGSIYVRPEMYEAFTTTSPWSVIKDRYVAYDPDDPNNTRHIF